MCDIVFAVKVRKTLVGREGVEGREWESLRNPISSSFASDVKGVRQPGKTLSGPIFSTLFQIH